MMLSTFSAVYYSPHILLLWRAQKSSNFVFQHCLGHVDFHVSVLISLSIAIGKKKENPAAILS